MNVILCHNLLPLIHIFRFLNFKVLWTWSSNSFCPQGSIFQVQLWSTLLQYFYLQLLNTSTCISVTLQTQIILCCGWDFEWDHRSVFTDREIDDSEKLWILALIIGQASNLSIPDLDDTFDWIHVWLTCQTHLMQSTKTSRYNTRFTAALLTIIPAQKQCRLLPLSGSIIRQWIQEAPWDFAHC